MRSKSKTLFAGCVFFVFGSLILFIERLTNTGISRLIGELYCGKDYLKVTGQPGDGMCGFNMDMVVGLICFFLILAGLLFVITGVVKMIEKRAKD